MEHMPHDENDEALGENSAESVDIERFGFLQEDRQVIKDLIAGIRRSLRRKSITPQQISGLGKLLHGFERLPRPTSDIDITVTSSCRTPDLFSYQSVSLSESSFEFLNGGSEYTPNVGSDTYTRFSFRVEVGGYRDEVEVTEVEEWMTSFIESLSDEDQEFEVEDLDETSVLNWHEKTPEDDWDQLDSEY